MTNTPLATYLGIAQSSNEDDVLRLLIHTGIRVVGADEGSLLVHDRAAGELVFAMTTGSAASEAALIGQRVPLGEGLTGLAALTGEPQVGAPTYRDVEQSQQIDTPEGDPSAVIAAPMVLDDALIGVITAVSVDPAVQFTQSHVGLFAHISTVAALLVNQNQRLQAAEALSGSEGDSRARLDPEEQRIIECVEQLSAKHARKTEIADLLQAIVAVAGR